MGGLQIAPGRQANVHHEELIDGDGRSRLSRCHLQNTDSRSQRPRRGAVGGGPTMRLFSGFPVFVH
jgi:hypothetical protein